jgi:7-carboxy-7-deazaguanine synthase
VIRLNDCYACIQGEGVLAGTPMVLVRLQGCGVGCPWCDTRETWANDARNRVDSIDEAVGTNPRWVDADPDSIAARARGLAPAIRWALVTGGEPAEQPLRPLVDALHGVGFSVAIETSGTADGHIDAGIDWICVSPKLGMPGGKPILAEALTGAHEIKMVVGKPADLEALDGLLAGVGHGRTQVTLQPLSQSPKATELCIRTCLERGWRLSLQLHKYIEQR